MSEVPRSLTGIVTRNFMALGVGELAARAITFVTVVYIARAIGAEAYGVVGFAAAVVLYFAGIADAGIEALGPREVANDKERLRGLVCTIVLVRLSIAGMLSVLLAATGLLFLPNPDGQILALQSLTLFAVALSTRWVFVGFEKAGRISLARVLGESLRFGLVFLLVHSAADIFLVPVTQASAEVLASVVLLVLLQRSRGFAGCALKLKEAWPVFRSASPLVATGLLGLVIYNSDLIVIRVFRGSEAVGIYLAAYTLIALIGNLGTAYAASLLPTITRARIDDGEQNQLYRTSIGHVVALSLPMAGGGIILAPQIIDFAFGSEFAESSLILAVLLGSVPLVLIRMVQQTALVSRGQQKRVMRITTWAAALNVVLNLALVPIYGLVGAAAATVATEALRLALVQVFVRDQGFPMTGGGLFPQAVIATGTMVAALHLASIDRVWIALPFGALVYGAVLGAFAIPLLRRAAS